MAAGLVAVAKLSELPPGRVKKVIVEGKEVALYNAGGTIRATSNICPHQGGPLDEGELDGNLIICPWHGWMFNIEDGCSVMSPNLRIRTYEVQVQGDDILIKSS